MRRVRNLLALFQVAALRLWSNRGLTACATAGLVAAVALIVSIPLYSDGVNHRLLQERLEREGQPPYAFLFWYVGAWRGLVEWEDVAPLDTYLAGEAPGTIGLPVEQRVDYLQTAGLHLFPVSEATYADEQEALTEVSIGALSDFRSHIHVLEGALPHPPTGTDAPLEVLITLSLAENLGLQVGEEYVVFARPNRRGLKDGFQRTVCVAGVWAPINPADSYWFHEYGTFDDVFLISKETFLEEIAPATRGEIALAEWYLVFDGRDVHVEDTMPLLGRIGAVATRVAALLPRAELAESPAGAILRYHQDARLRTILLYTFGIPVLALVLYFIAQVWGMIVSRQRNEVAMLRSRGTAVWQVLGIYLLEGVIVGLIAMLVGPLVGNNLAQAMGRTTSFLRLTSGPPSPAMTTRLSWINLRFGVLALGVSVATSLIPALSAARHTIISYKQEQARVVRRPLWQRSFVDLLLLIPALYGYYLLRERGTISILGQGTPRTSSSPFENPLLFLVPILFIFSLSLIIIRLMPLVVRLLAWAAGLWRGAVPVLVLRHLARTPGQYTGPLLLLILTPSLAVFTASMASTLDAHLVDQIYYDTGGDLNLVELGQSTEGQADDRPVQPALPDAEEEQAGPEWLFLPVSDHLLIPGVHAATRVGDYKMTELRGYVNFRLLGVDRASFPHVAHFRRDYAPEPLGALMNALAMQWDGLLVDRRAMAAHNWRVGDKVRARINVGDRPEVAFTIVGLLDYFPTAYPEDGSFAVANLDFLFEQLGGRYPYDVWLAAEEGLTADRVKEGAAQIGFNLISVYDARGRIAEMQMQPGRQGFFGLLSIGFLTTAFLTVLGFLIYSYVSFQRRFIQFGMLRALGLSVRQMAALLAGEQLALVATGLVGGTFLGWLSGKMFIPFLQVRAGRHPLTPPYVVQIAWGDVVIVYVIFGLMFVAAAVVLLGLLRRMRVFEAVKLGETI